MENQGSSWNVLWKWCSWKFLKWKNTCAEVFFFLKKTLHNGLLQLYLKKIPSQVISCQFCKIFKNTFFTENLQTSACGNGHAQPTSLTVWNIWQNFFAKCNFFHQTQALFNVSLMCSAFNSSYIFEIFPQCSRTMVVLYDHEMGAQAKAFTPSLGDL